jgi:hypothetical protein
LFDCLYSCLQLWFGASIAAHGVENDFHYLLLASSRHGMHGLY